MPRSVKKGPFIDEKLLLSIQVMNARNEKKVIKTWSRASTISPDFVGHPVAGPNGNKFIPVYITENMVGHKLVSSHQHGCFVGMAEDFRTSGQDRAKSYES